MRRLLVLLWALLCPVSLATAQVSFGIEAPGLSIGINIPVYPQLVRVPGYPVYYAPQANSNYFFYDGMYWVYQQDNWYASSWYNGPWALVAPEAVPYFVLRIPVRYYRRPPAYFRGWSTNAPPRWGEHWGNNWAQSRQGWDNWDRRSVPAPAPLPVYQRQYSGNKYPRVEQQYVLQGQNYRYQPHEAVVQQHSQQKAQQQQQREAASRQKAQQQQAASQQKAQQQQQQQAASQQKAQQQQAASQQKAQQQQQREAASQQKVQQQQAASQQKAQQQQQRQQQPQGAAQQTAQQPQQAAAAPHEQKAQKPAPEKAEQKGGGEQAK